MTNNMDIWPELYEVETNSSRSSPYDASESFNEILGSPLSFSESPDLASSPSPIPFPSVAYGDALSGSSPATITMTGLTGVQSDIDSQVPDVSMSAVYDRTGDHVHGAEDTDPNVVPDVENAVDMSEVVQSLIPANFSFKTNIFLEIVPSPTRPTTKVPKAKTEKVRRGVSKKKKGKEHKGKRVKFNQSPLYLRLHGAVKSKAKKSRPTTVQDQRRRAGWITKAYSKMYPKLAALLNQVAEERKLDKKKLALEKVVYNHRYHKLPMEFLEAQEGVPYKLLCRREDKEELSLEELTEIQIWYQYLEAEAHYWGGHRRTMSGKRFMPFSEYLEKV